MPRNNTLCLDTSVQGSYTSTCIAARHMRSHACKATVLGYVHEREYYGQGSYTLEKATPLRGGQFESKRGGGGHCPPLDLGLGNHCKVHSNHTAGLITALQSGCHLQNDHGCRLYTHILSQTCSCLRKLGIMVRFGTPMQGRLLRWIFSTRLHQVQPQFSWGPNPHRCTIHTSWPPQV